MSEDPSDYTKLGEVTGQYKHCSDGDVVIEPHDGNHLGIEKALDVPEVEQFDRDQLPDGAFYFRATENRHEIPGLRVGFEVYEHDESGDLQIGEVWQSDDGFNLLLKRVAELEQRLR